MRSQASRPRKTLAALAALGIGSLLLAGCTTGGNTDPSESATNTGGSGDASTVRLAEVNELTSFNPNHTNQNLDINSKVSYLTHASFLYVTNEFEIAYDESFGTVEKLSDEPLTVEYTIAEGRTWSDGTAITADDMLFYWAVNSGHFDDVTLDEATGEAISGSTLFQIAGSTEGLGQSQLPVISEDNMSMTITYDQPYVDWNLIDPIDQPIHVVAEKSGTTVEELVNAIMTAPEGDPAAPTDSKDPVLTAAADFWNSGFDVTSLPSDESLFLSNGPFIVSAWEPTQSLTLVKNESYEGMREAQFDQLVIRFIGDSNAQVTGLQNGEVDIINPQASADTLTQLEALPGVEVITDNQLSYDHIDLTFAGVFADPAVREAFLLTIPRQQILETIVTPISPDSEVLNSQIFVPANVDYADAVAANGSSAYGEVDIERAKELLAGQTPTVRILYNTDNPNRVDAFQAIQASAAEAGFNIVDEGDPNWGSRLGSDDYDASIFGWISPGVGTTALPQIFAAGGGGNYNKYNNARVTELANATQTMTDPADVVAAQIEIDTLTFEDAYGLPLFQSPGVLAYSDRLGGVEYMANQTGPIWNFWEWTIE
ncbi:ABC transporter family substrate-binding protein [Humidisolicoccus flavus]|uniref:ABC transporter family substrate-binding protein n=1 Tax=Humidisolicoccus flavus TaxID=3111414 RepID=UPI003248B82A